MQGPPTSVGLGGRPGRFNPLCAGSSGAGSTPTLQLNKSSTRFNPLCAGSSGAGRSSKIGPGHTGRFNPLCAGSSGAGDYDYEWEMDFARKFQSPMRGE